MLTRCVAGWKRLRVQKTRERQALAPAQRLGSLAFKVFRPEIVERQNIFGTQTSRLHGGGNLRGKQAKDLALELDRQRLFAERAKIPARRPRRVTRMAS